MKHYYRNPKTEELIIWSGDNNDILILEKIRDIQLFTERDVTDPENEEEEEEREEEIVKTPRKTRRKITKGTIARMRIRREEGVSIRDIAEEMNISVNSVYNKLKDYEKPNG